MDFLDNEGCFRVGKYGPVSSIEPRATVEWVVRNDADYLDWVVNSSECCDEDIEVIEASLRLTR